MNSLEKYRENLEDKQFHQQKNRNKHTSKKVEIKKAVTIKTKNE